MKALIKCAAASYPQEGVKFAEAQAKEIADETMSSDYLQTRSRSTHNRYVRFERMNIKNVKLLDLLQTLKENETTRKSLGVSHRDSAVRNVSEPQIVLVLVAPVHFYIMNLTYLFLSMQHTFWRPHARE